MNYKVGSLFAGVGGICLGFKNAKNKNASFELTWANEIDQYAAHTYRQNFRHSLIEGDIEKIVNIDRCISSEEREEYQLKQKKILEQPIDVLTGGFPCQAFSIAGERKGFDDQRGNLFWSIIDLVKLHYNKHGVKPRILFLENVKNLKNHDSGNTYSVIKKELEKSGYIVKEAILNTMDYTEIPQNRERIFIVCFREERDASEFKLFDIDEKGNSVNLNDLKINHSKEDRKNQIKSILESKTVDEKYYYTKDKYPSYFITEEEYNLMPLTDRKDVRINLDEQIDEENEFYQVRRGMYVRKNMSGVCPTLTANMGTGGHNVPLIKVNDRVRKLTPVETFRLQGFPVLDSGISMIDGGERYILPVEFKGKKYSDARLYKQAGNAVTVNVITVIANILLDIMSKNDIKK